MPGLETDLWTPLRGQGAVGLVIHVGKRTRYASTTAQATGLVATMLLDLDESVDADWTQTALGAPPYPLGVLVDQAGVVRRIVVDDEPEPAQWRTWIEELLAE